MSEKSDLSFLRELAIKLEKLLHPEQVEQKPKEA
jgi:hypothetical protein